jgi:hypothetical protein
MTPEETNNQIEDMIKRLKAQYDLFFSGARKIPPIEDRKRLDVLIRETTKNRIRDNGQRFRFNTLVSRYVQYQELWNRQMREREEGPLDYRRRAAAFGSEALPLPPPAPPPPAPRQERNVTSPDAGSYVRVTSESNGEAIAALHARISEAQREIGKDALLTVRQVAAMVEKQATELRSRYGVSAIAFRVETVDGKVKIKAKPLQD